MSVFFAVAAVAAVSSFAAEKAPSKGEKLFALTVRPLFAEKCFGCHGEDPEKIKGDYVMTDRESLLKGGETYGKDAVVVGDGAKSPLYAMVLREEPDFEMPPKEADQLTRQEADAIRDWIDAGAPWPEDARIAWIQKNHAPGVTVKTSGGLNDGWTHRRYDPAGLWAYRPVKAPDPTGLGEGLNPVDSLIGAALAEKGLKAAPRADPRTLIRRVTFDLTGLPPKPEEIEAFAAAAERDAEGAWRDLVDRLLDSPQYGEQWARHWLDVVRYADSSGFANDYERPNTWRYRDYVIRAFNEDKPYDQFIREQIAGDEIDRGDPEMLIAVGFLRMGPWEHTGMSVAKVTRQLFLDDITDSVGQVFLAQALQCARCHDHKFDPVPTRDYYAMQAVFATTQFAEVDAPWLPEENTGGMEEDERYHRLRDEANEALLARLSEKQREYERAWFAEKGLPYRSRAEAKKAKAPAKDLPPGKLFRTPDEFGQERIGRKWDNRFGWEFDRYRPIAYTVYDGKTRTVKAEYNRLEMPGDPMKEGELEKTAILQTGNPFAPAAPVKPGVLSAVPGGLDTAIPDAVSGRRTALADWIASPENTLTARVMANRVWLWHFGRGLAGNPNNFGSTGKRPTHPELLDWLANELVTNGWSIKHLHRVILSSEAYRRSCEHPDAASVREKD
ncbi:MAG: PSD1 domain-containing protein, partial [Akkermansiaceae bacterium]|nr:PSD1 domain-containing protein [Akkermansiaceae bacterium]